MYDDEEERNDRHKRSFSEDETDNTTHSRTKRSLFGNPCMQGKAMRTTVLYGVDAETGSVLELYQDPGGTKTKFDCVPTLRIGTDKRFWGANAILIMTSSYY